MKAKALDSVFKYHMFSRGDRLLTACSGGADSVCLLHFLCGLRESFNITVEAIHLNHNLRGDESIRDERFVRELCDGWKVPLNVLSADVATLAKESGESVELCGRRLRYELFCREAEKNSARLAVAHTLDDNVETVFINLIRGTGLRGLAGIPPVRGNIIRPLIGCSRSDVEAYLAEHGVSYVTDSSNLSEAYTRNRVRKKILPMFAAENPRFAEHMADMTRQLRDDADYLDLLATEASASIILKDGRFDRSGFLTLPDPLKSRVLSGILKGEGLPRERDIIRRLTGIIEAGTGGEQLSREYIFRCGQDSFLLCRPDTEQPFFSLELYAESLLSGGEWEVFPGKVVRINAKEQINLKKTQVFNKKVLTYRLDCDKIKSIIVVRQKLSGDRLRLPGRGISKTLKNLFQESGVPPLERGRRVILADGDGLILAEGLGVDERVAVTGLTKNIAVVEITEEFHA